MKLGGEKGRLDGNGWGVGPTPQPSFAHARPCTLCPTVRIPTPCRPTPNKHPLHTRMCTRAPQVAPYPPNHKATLCQTPAAHPRTCTRAPQVAAYPPNHKTGGGKNSLPRNLQLPGSDTKVGPRVRAHACAGRLQGAGCRARAAHWHTAPAVAGHAGAAHNSSGPHTHTAAACRLAGPPLRGQARQWPPPGGAGARGVQLQRRGAAAGREGRHVRDVLSPLCQPRVLAACVAVLLAGRALMRRMRGFRFVCASCTRTPRAAGAQLPCVAGNSS